MLDAYVCLNTNEHKICFMFGNTCFKLKVDKNVVGISKILQYDSTSGYVSLLLHMSDDTLKPKAYVLSVCCQKFDLKPDIIMGAFSNMEIAN